MKKFALIFLSMLVMVSVFTGCSEKDSTGPEDNDPIAPALAEVVDIEFILPADLTSYVATDVDYEGVITPGYALDQFVSEVDVNAYLDEDGFDTRALFAVEIVSSDEDGNWSPRLRDVGDLRWDQFVTGNVLPEQSGKTFFADESIPGTFNVKHATYFKLYRKLDVALDGTTTTFETGAFETSEITYIKNDETRTEIGFSLVNLISDYVTEDPEDYSYYFTAADGWENTDTSNLFSWEDIQCGYWLTEENKAIFLNEDTTLKWKSVKVLEKINLAEID